METQKTPNSQSNPGKEKWSWKNQSSGDFKLKAMLIYYSQIPRALKNYTKSTLLMLYKWKDKTRMIAYLFTPWFTEYFKPTVDTYHSDKKKKILLKISLFIAHSPGHPWALMEMYNEINVAFFPLAQYPFCSPVEQWLISMFKS